MESLENRAKEFMSKHGFSSDDFSHFNRVNKLCMVVGKAENADMAILMPAAILHDLGKAVSRKKPSADHGEESTKIAERMLAQSGFSGKDLERILYAIRAHGISKGVVPSTLEARVLQDADRLDALGAVGIAREFAYAGAKGISICDNNDPFAKKRGLDDKHYALDHFYTRLLELPETMHTKAARRIAEGRVGFMRLFLEQFVKETG